MSDEGQVLWVNPAVERFTGRTPSECLAMEDYPLQLVAEEDRRRIAGYLHEAQGGRVENNVEFRVLHRDGTRRWAAISGQSMRGSEDRSLGFRTSVRDVTEKRDMREQLRLHNKHLEQLVQERTARVAELEKHRLKMEKLAALGELAAGVAHEINNPLAGIRNAFALLKRHLPPSVKHYDKLDLIDSEIERISGITHQMYQLYRPSQQRSTTFSIRRCIEEIRVLTRPMSRKWKVDVRTEYGSMVPGGDLAADEVHLREEELKQVMLNLIHNAIQASEAGHEVSVSAATELDRLEIQVADQGHGIPPEFMAKVFDPFFSTKTAKVGQGMGLGLSVTRGLVEAMEGTIEIATETGTGTVFVVRLPRSLSPPRDVTPDMQGT